MKRLITYLLYLFVAVGTVAQENVSGVAVDKKKNEPQATLLKEVTVKADRIREQGDTVLYKVESFALPKDGSIGDVLSRLPGINVDGSGKIQYQGVDINKFYIDGFDMFGGKYGVATDGISYSDVSEVVVMENHQPVQVLSGINFSDQAAINLKLNDKAKATWEFSGKAGGGYSCQPDGAIWDIEMFGMAIMPKFQGLTTFKTNNNGDGLSSLAADFFASPRGTELSRYVGVSLPDVPSLGQDRTLFNRTALFSTNALWKLGRGELKAQIDYSFNRVEAVASNITTYYLKKGDLVVTENRDGIDRMHSLSGKFIYELNQKTTFINNTLKTDIDWDDVQLGVTGTLHNDQTASLPDYYVSNDFKLIKRFNGKHIVTFISKNEWESLPQTLSVTMRDGFMRQNVKDHAFYTNESAAYAFYVNDITISLEGGLKGYLRSLNTDWLDIPTKISGVSDEVASLGETITNVMSTNYFTVYATPRFEYRLRRVNFSLDAPLSFARYTFDKALANRDEVYFSPSLRMNWIPSNCFSVEVRGGTGRSPMELNLIQPGYVMTNYRSFRRGVDDFYNSTSQNVSANISYKHTRYGLFADAFVMQSWNSTPYTMEQQLLGSYVVYSYTPAKNDGQMLMAGGRIGKALDFMKGSAGINGSFSRDESHLISENSTVNSVGTSWSVGAKINGAPLSWLSFDYSIAYSSSRLAMDDTNASWLGNVVNEIELKIKPHRKWGWTITGDYYRNELTTDRFKNVFLLDTEVSFKINKHLSVTAELNNIFNHRTYNYTTYNQLSSTESQRWLRGRELMFSISFSK